MHTETRQANAVPETHRAPLVELSNEMVRLYKDLFGRGPTKARTDFAGPDIVICTLQESLTQAERNMAELGEHQRLRDVRMFFQHASENDFKETVEKVLGRKVWAFVSGMDTHEDVAAEVFYLEPADGRANGETAE